MYHVRRTEHRRAVERTREMTREQMMDDMIRRYGFEDELVVEFCEFVEAVEDLNRVVFVYSVLMRG